MLSLQTVLLQWLYFYFFHKDLNHQQREFLNPTSHPGENLLRLFHIKSSLYQSLPLAKAKSFSVSLLSRILQILLNFSPLGENMKSTRLVYFLFIWHVKS